MSHPRRALRQNTHNKPLLISGLGCILRIGSLEAFSVGFRLGFESGYKKPRLVAGFRGSLWGLLGSGGGRGSCSGVLGRVEALFFDLGRRLALAVAEIEEAGAHDLRGAFDFDLLDVRGVDREGALDAFAEGDAANSEGGVDASALTLDDDAGEGLGALLVAFANLGGYLDAVADLEIMVSAGGLQLGLGGKLDEGMVAHGWCSWSFIRSGLRCFVFSICLSRRHFSISA